MIKKSDLWAVFAGTSTPSLLIDGEKCQYKVLAANLGFCQLAGKSEQAFIGLRAKEVFQVFTTGSNLSFLEDLDDALALVSAKKKPFDMRVQRVFLPAQHSGSTRERKWRIILKPIFGESTQGRLLLLSITDVTEQIHLQEKDKALYFNLTCHQQIYKGIFENHPNMLFKIEPDGFFTSINERFTAILGYEQEELKQRKLYDLATAEDQPILKGMVEKCMQKTPVNFQVNFLSKGRDKKNCEASLMPLVVQEKIVGIYGILVDRTEEKIQQHHALQKSIFTDTITQVTKVLLEETEGFGFFRQVLALTGNAILADRITALRFDEERQTLQELSRWEAADIQCPEIQQDFAVEDFKACMGQLEKNRIFKSRTNDLKKGQLLSKLKDRHTKSCMIFPLICNDILWGCIVLEDCHSERLWGMEDVTFFKTIVGNLTITIERVKNKNDLRDSEGKYNGILRNIPGVAYRCLDDDHWTMQYLHEEFYNFTGYDVKDVLGNRKMAFADLVHEDDLYPIAKSIEQREEFFQVTYRLKCADGSVKWVEDWGTKAFRENGEVSHIDGVIWDITEKMEAEEKLSQTHRRYEAFIHKGEELYAISDEDGNFKFASENYEAILGYKGSDLIGKNVVPYIHPDDLEPVFQDFVQVREGERYKSNPYRFLHADKSWRWLESTLTHLLQDEAVQGIIINSRDITEKIEAEERLKLIHRRYRSLIQKGGELFAIADEEGTFVFNSDNYKTLLGYDNSDLIGRLALDFVHPEDLPAVYAEFLSIKDKKQIHLAPFRFKNKQQEWRWIESIITNLIDDKAVQGIIINSRDVTDRIAEIHRLKMMERVTTSSHDGVAIIEAKNGSIFTGEIVFINEAMLELSGITSEEVIGQPISSFYAQVKDSEALEKAILNFDPLKLNTFELEKIHTKGKTYWVNIEIYPVRDHQDTISHYVLSERDISAEKKQEWRKGLLASLLSTFDLHAGIEEGLVEVLKVFSQYAGISLSEAWLVATDQSHLTLAAHHVTSQTGRDFIKFSAQKKVSRGEGMPGTIWETGQPLYLYPQHRDPRFPRREVLYKEGLGYAYGIPLVSKEKVLGVFLFFTTESLGSRLQQFEEIFSEVSLKVGMEIERKQALEELKNFFELSKDLMCILHGDKLHKVNSGLTTSLGYEEHELINQSIFNFIHPQDRLKSEEELVANFSGHEAPYFQNRVLTKSGAVKWIAWSKVVDKKAQVIYAVGKDITHSKEVEADLLSMNRKLNTAQKIGKVGYWNLNLDTKVLEWTDEVYNIYGKTKTDFTPSFENFLAYVHPEDRHMLMLHDDHHPNQELYEYQHRLLLDDGQMKHVYQKINLLKCEDGKVVGWEGVIQDITEIKQYELALEESNQRFQLAMKATEEMVWDWDLQTNHVTRSRDFYNKGNHEVVLTTLTAWKNWLHPEDQERVISSIINAIQNPQQEDWSEEYRFRNEDGAIFHAIDRATIIRDKEGKATRLVGAVLDVSESRQMLHQIKAQNQQLRQIAWTQSHEVRAPLSRMMGIMNMLESEDEAVAFDMFKQMLPHLKSSVAELDDVIRKVVQTTVKSLDNLPEQDA